MSLNLYLKRAFAALKVCSGELRRAKKTAELPSAARSSSTNRNEFARAAHINNLFFELRHRRNHHGR
jgi:hypothetical protein